MTYIIISLAAFFTAGLTFFSGFGLATVLTPVFILFFPIPIAISLTAIVHFLNNLFKLFLVGRHGDKEVLLKFGIPAVISAILGSLLLSTIVKKSLFVNYHLFNHDFSVRFVNYIIGLIILSFVIIEIIPLLNRISFDKNLLPLGGFLSGFFGGLSGNQGAFRSLFLLKCNLSTEQFIATGIIIACFVDIARLIVYGINFISREIINNAALLIVVVISALLGSFIANRYMQKVTIKFVQNIVTVMLFVISIGLITGLI